MSTENFGKFKLTIEEENRDHNFIHDKLCKELQDKDHEMHPRPRDEHKFKQAKEFFAILDLMNKVYLEREMRDPDYWKKNNFFEVFNEVRLSLKSSI